MQVWKVKKKQNTKKNTHKKKHLKKKCWSIIFLMRLGLTWSHRAKRGFETLQFHAPHRSGCRLHPWEK